MVTAALVHRARHSTRLSPSSRSFILSFHQMKASLCGVLEGQLLVLRCACTLVAFPLWRLHAFQIPLSTLYLRAGPQALDPNRGSLTAELEGSLVCRVSPKTARATQRDAVSKTNISSKCLLCKVVKAVLLSEYEDFGVRPELCQSAFQH